MSQYCRYCGYMVCGDVNFCTEKGFALSDEQIKRTNKCKYFEINPIDALGSDKQYCPRKQKENSNSEQILIGEINEQQTIKNS